MSQPRSNGITLAALTLVLGTATLALSCSGAQSPASSTVAKPGCIGCSTDGKTTPRLADGKPDLNGYWNGNPPNPNAPAGGGGGGGRVMNRYDDGSIIFDFSTEYNEENGVGRICQSDDCQAPNQPPYNAEWMARVKKIADTQFGGTTALDPVHACRPQGVPRAGVNGIQIVHTPHVVAVLYEGAPYSTYRLIYTDGRPHPEEPESSFWGHSTGKWEGDTLVVDVVALTEESWVGGGGATGRNRNTSIHSDQLHVTERWTRDGDVLTYEATVDDPVAFTKPWVITPRRVQHAPAGEEIYENICNPNNTHFVAPDAKDRDIQTSCGYRCQDDAPSASAEAAAAMISGTWDVTTRFTDRVANEKWTFEQKGNAITVKAARDGGEIPGAGSLEGAFLRVTAKDGDKEYKVRATVDGDAMDGSITLGVGQQFLWHATRAK